MFTTPYINGNWIRRPGSEHLVVEDPATGARLAEVAVATDGDCQLAVDAAASALPLWSETPPRERAEVLRRAWELMIAERERFERLIVSENGKPLVDAAAEVSYAAEFFRWFSEEAVRVSGDMRRSPAGGGWIMVTRESAGVALLVTPWNFPAAMVTRKIAPALAAGCTVVLKPAMETPLTALAITDLLERAGVPPGVVNTITPHPPGPAVGEILNDPRVRVLSFTGSTEVGSTLMQAAAPNVVRCCLELGGNAPFIVLDDADIDAAVDGLMVAKLRNGGAACTAANRVLVDRRVVDEFTESFADRVRSVRLGAGADPETTLGPLINESSRRRIDELVSSTVAEGAAVVVGGSAPEGPGYFYDATVLAEVPHHASILRREIFGPVAALVTVDGAEQAVGVANDSAAGLVAYAYTRDLDKAMSVSRKLKYGMVGINRSLVSDPAAPFGGMKHSGLGREGAREGIEEFLELKYTALPYS